MKDMTAVLHGGLLGAVIELSIEVLLAEVHATNVVAHAGIGGAVPSCITGFSTALFSIVCVSHIAFSHFRSFAKTVVFQTICLPILCVLWFATAALTALTAETLGPERCYSDDLYVICAKLPWIKLCSYVNCIILAVYSAILLVLTLHAEHAGHPNVWMESTLALPYSKDAYLSHRFSGDPRNE
ncbi:hypothetical protein PC9H_009224 [Pleurotus ostreatus]|uniref:Transmembrane protein n=1 Tax=Pleurotus ostreatus TaxID=5322 RepID=A0A8H7DRV3_PLEOS|nr:uncharacterized protein PC9H_009224 [Pleurotus ostreatus]KAF7423926.1 hypothetical protein PC9H_009224 [Pleurotus ostreatus]